MNIEDFPKAGEICENCKERWIKAGKSPKKLVALPSYTMRYHSPIVVCSYCDGGLIEKLAMAIVKKRDEAASAT